MSVGVPTSSVFCEFWDPTTIYPRFSTVCSLSCPTLIISFLLQLLTAAFCLDGLLILSSPGPYVVLLWMFLQSPCLQIPLGRFSFSSLAALLPCNLLPEHLPLKCTVTRDCGFDKVGHLCLDQSRKSRLKQVMGISRGIVNGLMTTNILQSPIPSSNLLLPLIYCSILDKYYQLVCSACLFGHCIVALMLKKCYRA